MKKMDLFCASPASTAICSSQGHRSMIRRGTRPISRQNSKSYVPCSSQLPITPKPYYEKSRKSTSTKQSDLHRKSSAHSRESSAKQSDLHRKSSADSRESSVKQNDLHRKNSADISDPHSPAGSSRYLLSDRPYIDWISESDDQVSALVPTQHAKPMHKSSNDSPARRSSSLVPSRGWTLESDHVSALVPTQINAKPRHVSSDDSPALKSSSSARSHDQVVVLWVSIHCKGCEGKVRKHISKMEGVTSFSIDLATKKVTVIGNVTPLSVLASVSKVKNAQLWPSATSSLPSPSPRWST